MDWNYPKVLCKRLDITRKTKKRILLKKVADNVYASGVLTKLENIPVDGSLTFTANIYLGPQSKEDLAAAAEGLPYTVDYGWLTFIASPLFSVLSGIQKVVINWGIAIILLTVLIKLLFIHFQLQAINQWLKCAKLLHDCKA